MDRTLVLPQEPTLNLLGKRLRDLPKVPVVQVLFFLGLHVGLGLIGARYTLIATLHAGVVLLVGAWFALSARNLTRVAYVAAYITGAETFWRMTRTPLFWEFGKYAVAGVLLLALLRTGRLRGPLPAFCYFILLLPSIVLPMANLDNETLSEELRFNLSGPLALAVCIWFFSHLRLTLPELYRLFLALIAPVVSIVTVAAYSTLTAAELRFGNNSNDITSGGFGPNQVSAILGLGALLAFFWALDKAIPLSLRICLFLLTLGLLTQSALTFSRTGLYLAVIGAVLASFFLIGEARLRLQLLAVLLLLGIAAYFVILPRLDRFTEGALSRRFSNTTATGREELARIDLKVFMENPVFGVGPGQASQYRQRYYGRAAAHTEFSRLLAEHGLFGLIAVGLLLYMSAQHFLRARSAQGKALVLSMIGWSFLFMTGSAMRLVAPSFIFGLTAAAILPVCRPATAERRTKAKPPTPITS